MNEMAFSPLLSPGAYSHPSTPGAPVGRNASRMHGSQEFIPATVPQGAEMSFECNYDTKSRTFTKTGSGQSRTFAKTGSGQRNEKCDKRNVSVGFDGPESSCAKGFFDTKTGRYLLWFWVSPAGAFEYMDLFLNVVLIENCCSALNLPRQARNRRNEGTHRPTMMAVFFFDLAKQATESTSHLFGSGTG